MINYDEAIQRYLDTLVKSQESNQANIGTLETQEKTFLDRLRERRAMAQSASDRFQKDASGALDSNSPVPINPREVFGAFNSFSNAVMDKVAPAEADYKDAVGQLTTARQYGEQSQLSGLQQLIDMIQNQEKLKMDQAQSDRDYQLRAGEAAAKGITIDPKTGKISVNQSVSNPVREVIEQGGKDLLNFEKMTESELRDLATAIINAGGVEAYRKSASYKDLITGNKELSEADAKAASILNGVMTIEGAFPEGTKNQLLGRTGALVNRLPQWLRGQESIKSESTITQFSTEQIKNLSGVAVSPAEMERLRGYLPDPRDDENTIATKVQNLKKAVQMNMEVREKAVRGGLTMAEATEKYLPELLKKYGFEDQVSTYKPKSASEYWDEIDK